MKKLVLSLILIFPLLGYSQVEMEYPHCGCVDYIDEITPFLNGSYERKCSNELVEKGQFSDGMKIGVWESFSVNGQKIREFNYDDSGALNGKVKSYYANGTMKLEGEFVANKKSGTWTYYNSRGKPQKQGTYEDGKAVGVWRIYDKKGKKEEIVFDFSENKYLQDNPSLRYFENEEIIQNDNKGEWYILYYPELGESVGYEPIEHLGLAIDLYVNNLELPLEFWDTYVSYNYESTLIFEEGILSTVEVREIGNHLDETTTLPFLVITNEKDKIRQIEHSDFSKKMLEFKIKEALYITGPFKPDASTVVLYTPFVVNDIKNRR